LMKQFLETLDARECISIAFKTAAPYEMSNVGVTAVIHDIGEDITQKRNSCWRNESLSLDSIKEAKEMTIESSNTSIGQWRDKWDRNVTEVIRRSLNEVFGAQSIFMVNEGLGDEPGHL
jgi:hypothetical protein